MARVIKQMTPLAVKYPWPKWTDGQFYEVRCGKGYKISDAGFRPVLHGHANANDLTVITRNPKPGFVVS